MGKQERKKMDLPSGEMAALLILCATFFVGGVAGCLFAGLSSGSGAEELGAYLTDYLALVRQGSVTASFWSILWRQGIYFLGVIALGATAIGVVGLPVLFGIRGFFFAFSVACFCRVFGEIGLLPALVMFALPACLWAPALFLSGTQGFVGAQAQLRRKMGDTRSVLPFDMAYCGRLGIGVVLMVACGLAEYMMVPVLLRAAARVFM